MRELVTPIRVAPLAPALALAAPPHRLDAAQPEVQPVEPAPTPAAAPVAQPSPAAKPAAPAQAPAPAAVASPAALPRTGSAPLPLDASLPAAMTGLGAIITGLAIWRRRRPS